ncbi:MAG: hypothetical protein Q8L37_03175 [Candidatus Gottesmanbacteria bacterium]|nr:hypothetical protein [Candidatus Gottesmanbacteria bacterium]
MSETGEMPMPQEMRTENPVVASVKGAIEQATENEKGGLNDEYWKIRKELQGRIEPWHGGGIIKMYVQQMDKVTDVLWGGENRSWGAKLMEVKDRVMTRLAGTFIGLSSAAFDLVYNAGTWPVRRFLPVIPIPKDIAKRFAVATTHALTTKAAVEAAALIASKKSTEVVGKGLKVAGKAERAVGEAIVTAPEVAATMLQRRAEKAMYNILHPKDVQKPVAK